ncbi:MAG TPA: penicillin-insensitive murein endopeptidase, partial [Polyangiaceae bacterium]
MRRWLAGLILTGVLACQSSASTGAHTSFPAPAQRAAPAAKSDSRVQEPPNLPVGYQDQTSPSIDDAGDSDTHYSLAGETRVHPLDGKTEADLEQMLSSHPDALGSMSIGSPSGGTLLNSVALDSANGIEVVDPAHAWGTQETVDFVKACVAVVRAQFPNTPTLYVGHLSARNGGPLAPHLSHQSGRDVDSGYYYLDGARWYAPATAENLDAPRTWALIRALTGESDVEMILIDRSVQPILRQYALRAGEPSEWVEELFQGVPG